MTQCLLNTGCGPLRGETRDGLRFFRGIPYARTLRFQKPVPLNTWEGTLDATDAEIDCCQRGTYRPNPPSEESFFEKEFHREKPYRYAESPQTLSIVTPEGARDCPVLVFIHGGGFETGHVGEPPFGDCVEYPRRGIVFVSLGHRLNVFSLYECGNFGLHDMVAGIRWVYDHIADFGGDPGRITLMGQSAGAMSITDLCYSDALKGLVRGLILMSGGGPVPSFAGPWGREAAAPFWEAVRRKAGAGSHQEALALPGDVLWNAWYEVSRSWKGFQALQPGIDGEIIPAAPSDIVKAGKHLDVPVMIGVTSQDFMPMVLYEVALRWGLDNSRRGRAPVYGYFFDRCLPGGSYKAFHSADLWYMFGNMEQSWRPFGEADRALSARMIDHAAAFIRTGDPNGPGLPRWEPLSKKQKSFRLFDGVSDGHIRPLRCRKKLLHTTYRDKGPM